MPTPVKRSNFRAGLSIGSGGRQEPVEQNFPSGIGQRRQYEPGAGGTGQGYGTGMGYGTGQSESPAAPVVTPVARATSAATVGPATRSAPVAPRPLRAPTPNMGGTISTEVAPDVIATQRYGPSAAANRSPNRPNLGGTMVRNGATTVVPPSPSSAPINSPTTVNAQQTESADPLTGDGNAQAANTTAAVNPGSALGFSRRGEGIPRGSDAVADSNVGGSGIYARKFANPKSAGLYSDYIKKLFPA